MKFQDIFILFSNKIVIYTKCTTISRWLITVQAMKLDWNIREVFQVSVIKKKKKKKKKKKNKSLSSLSSFIYWREFGGHASKTLVRSKGNSLLKKPGDLMED